MPTPESAKPVLADLADGWMVRIIRDQCAAKTQYPFNEKLRTKSMDLTGASSFHPQWR